jgi:hypothetical protein
VVVVDEEYILEVVVPESLIVERDEERVCEVRTSDDPAVWVLEEPRYEKKKKKKKNERLMTE